MNPYDAPQSDWEEDLLQLKARLARVALFMIAVIAVGTTFYRFIDPTAGWVNAFYMTIITLTTVGYGEVIDLSGNPVGRLFTALLILVGMGGVFYFLTMATAFILEGQLGHVFRRRQVEKTIASLSDHLIVCGSGGTAMYTAAELLAVERRVVIICDHPERWDDVHKELPGTPIVLWGSRERRSSRGSRHQARRGRGRVHGERQGELGRNLRARGSSTLPSGSYPG